MEIQIPLILFTTFLAWSAGLFATQAVYALRGKGASSQMMALIISVILLAVGGISVLFHLQHALRIFNGFGNPTSGITQELVAIVILFVFMVIYFITLFRNNDGTVPKWLAVCSIVFSVVLIVVCAHSYMMPARPEWNNVFQIGSLLGASLGFGPATMALICSSTKVKTGFNNFVHKVIKTYTIGISAGGASAKASADAGDGETAEVAQPAKLAEGADDVNELNGKANMIGQIADAVLAVLFLIAMTVSVASFTQVGYYFDPTGPTRGIIDTSVYSPWSGNALPATIVTIVFLAVSVIAAVMGKKTGDWKKWGAVIMIAVLIATISMRVLFYILGGSVYPFTDLSV